MKAWLKSPVLHMIVIGASLFALTQAWGEDPLATQQQRSRLEISAISLEQAELDYTERVGRAPTADERVAIREYVIDEQVLVEYAISLDMQADPAAQTRLARLAEFVDEQPAGSRSERELAELAVELGLHRRDLIVRGILADRARRLIRAVVLVRRPAPEAVEAFYSANAEAFTRPVQVAFSLITVNTFIWPDTEARARELRARVDGEQLDFDAVMGLSDESVVAPVFARINQRDLEGQMGPDFAAAVFELRAGEWSAPVRSRHGHHLVFIDERVDARVPPLDEVRLDVEQKLTQIQADQWLARRIGELRAGYEIVVAGEVQ